MRFTISVNSGADYDSNEYFTTECNFNTEYLGEAVEKIELFLRGAGFNFGRLEVVNEDDLNPDVLATRLDSEDAEAEDRYSASTRY
jgi:hypothetical protein